MKSNKFFSDQEIYNECLVVCNAEFFDCTKNCDDSECSRKCIEELDGTFQQISKIFCYFSLWNFVSVQRRLSDWLCWLSGSSSLPRRVWRRAVEQRRVPKLRQWSCLRTGQFKTLKKFKIFFRTFAWKRARPTSTVTILATRDTVNSYFCVPVLKKR